MAKLSQIKKDFAELDFSFIDYLTYLDKSETNKFLPMLLKLIQAQLEEKKSKKDPEFVERIERETNRKITNNITIQSFHFFNEVFNNLFEDVSGNVIKEFIDLYQKNYITGVDVNNIKSIAELSEIYKKAHAKYLQNYSKKEVIKIFDNDEWLLVRPLTYEASKVYGADTKWCTTSRESSRHFYRYAYHGLLVYCINKNTGLKVAVHWEKDATSPTFWNVLDFQIDSIMSDLPSEILKIIREMDRSSNYELCSKEVLEIISNDPNLMELINDYEIRGEIYINEIEPRANPVQEEVLHINTTEEYDLPMLHGG